MIFLSRPEAGAVAEAYRHLVEARLHGQADLNDRFEMLLDEMLLGMRVCDAQRYLAAIWQRLLAVLARSAADEQGFAGGLDDLGRDGVEVVDLLDALNLAE